MRNHSVFVIHYNQRTSQGVWHDQDNYEHKSWSEPRAFTAVYVASTAEVARAHWDYWTQYSSTKDNPKVFVRMDELRPVTLLLEF